MSVVNNIKIRETKSGNRFYIMDDVMYDINFPLSWSLDHKPGTGPVECNNCECYGKINHVVVGYCGNCCREYDGKRGGYICHDNDEEELWEVFPHLDGVPKSKIGFCGVDYDEKYIPSYVWFRCYVNKQLDIYRGDILMSPREVFARMEELKQSSYDGDSDDYNDRRSRLDYMDIVDEMIYLNDVMY